MSRALVIIGLLIALIGLKWPWIGRIGLGLPGDVVLRHGNVTFYAPIATGILISLVLSLVLWLINR